MTGINLRLANLKGASMQNCVLHDATLAGADLEVYFILEVVSKK